MSTCECSVSIGECKSIGEEDVKLKRVRVNTLLTAVFYEAATNTSLFNDSKHLRRAILILSSF